MRSIIATLLALSTLLACTARAEVGFAPATIQQGKPQKQDVVLCPDIPPDRRYTCQEQAYWGKCQEQWMFMGAPKNPPGPGSFCAATCSRCPDIRPPNQIVIITIVQVRFTITLQNITPDQFGVEQQMNFRKAIARTAGVSPSLVVINKIEPHPYGLRVTATVSFPADIPGGQDIAVNSFQDTINRLNARRHRRSLTRRRMLAEDDAAVADSDTTALSPELEANPLTNALADFGLDIAPEGAQTTDVAQTDAAVGVPVDTDKTSADAMATNDEMIGVQIQAKAAADVPLPTPGEMNVSKGETKTVDVPESVQDDAKDIIDEGTDDDTTVDGGDGDDESSSTKDDDSKEGDDGEGDADVDTATDADTTSINEAMTSDDAPVENGGGDGSAPDLAKELGNLGFKTGGRRRD